MAMYRRPGLRRKSCDNKTITAQVRSDAGGQVPMSADCSPVDNSIGFNYPILTCGTCKGIVASPKFGRNSQETIVQRITDSESKDSLEQASFCGWIAPRASEFFRPTSSFEDEDDNEVIVLKRKRDCKIAVRPKFALPEHFVDKLKLLKRVEYQLSHDSPLRNLKEDSQKEPITVKKRKKLCFVDDPETAKRQKKSMSQRASQNRVLGCDERRNESVKGTPFVTPETLGPTRTSVIHAGNALGGMKTEIPDSGFAKQVCETGHWLHDTLRASILWTTMAGWSLLLLALLSCSRTGGNCAPLGAIINHLMGMHKTLRSMLALVVSLGTVFMLASFFDTLLAISCIVVGVFYATAAAPFSSTSSASFSPSSQ